MKPFFVRSTCRLCEAPAPQKVISIPPTPIADQYLLKEELVQTQETFPLDVYFCPQCFHMQLTTVVDPNILFRNYLYVTSSSPGLVDHFANYADDVVKKLQLPAGSFVCEIGSNDGSLLYSFKKHHMRVLGVDPAVQIAKEATAKGIETLPVFFDEAVAAQVREKHGAAEIVSANNVFAHSDNLSGMIRGVKNLLSKTGVFVIEVAYLVDFFEKNQFNTIYHEHLGYHSVRPLQTFFGRYGLELMDVERIPIKSGSLRCFAQHRGAPRPVSPRVQNLINLEKEMKLDRKETFLAFSEKLEGIRKELLRFIGDIKEKGQSVIGYGASPSSTTFICFFGLGDALDFIADDNPLKQYRYSPGYHIPVLPSDEIYKRHPDYILILAWSYANRIIQKHAGFKNGKGRFIVPFPEIKITVVWRKKCL